MKKVVVSTSKEIDTVQCKRCLKFTTEDSLHTCTPYQSYNQEDEFMGTETYHRDTIW